MYLLGQLQIFSHFGNNVLCLDFIDPPQNYCLFHQSPAKILYILENTCKEIVYVRYQALGGGVGK